MKVLTQFEVQWNIAHDS